MTDETTKRQIFDKLKEKEQINEQFDADLLSLTYYADMENNELGRAVQMLCDIHQYDYVFSSDFNSAVRKEIMGMAQMFRENTDVIEEEIVTKSKVKRLRWKNA